MCSLCARDGRARLAFFLFPLSSWIVLFVPTDSGEQNEGSNMEAALETIGVTYMHGLGARTRVDSVSSTLRTTMNGTDWVVVARATSRATDGW